MEEKKAPPTPEQSLRSMSWQVKVIAEELPRITAQLGSLATQVGEYVRLMKLKEETPF